MNVLYLFLLFVTTKAFVSVKIHRNAVYDRFSSCAFIGNISVNPDGSLQTCIWQCVHEYNCQTAVYFKDSHVCSMFSELCEENNIRPSGIERADVICYRKDHSKSIYYKSL